MSNILAEVIQTRDAVTGDEFRDLLQSVGFKLAQIKTEVVESLHSSLVLSETDIDKVTSWYVEILGIEEKVEDLNQKFQNDRKALKSAAEDIECLKGELNQCDDSINLLKTLVGVVKNLEKAEAADFFRASELVKAAKDELHYIVESFPSVEDHDWVMALESTISENITDVYQKASKEMRSVFQFQFGKNLLTIDLSKDLQQIFESLKNIGCASRVANKLANDVWQELLIKACQPDYYIEVTGKPKSKALKKEEPGYRRPLTIKMEVVENSNKIAIKVVKSSIPTTQIQIVFSNIYNVLHVFYDVFEGNPDVMKVFAQELGPKICEEMGDRSKTLKRLIFGAAEGDESQAKANIEAMQTFIEDLATQLNFVFPDSTVFDELESDFDSLFLVQVKQDLLVKIRTLVKGNLHDTHKVDESEGVESSIPEDISALHRNPFLFPECVVSKCIIELVNVVKKHLRRYKDDITMCDAAVNLYLSLISVPKHESDSGDLAPLTAVLIHNNSLYLAHHAALTFPMTEDKVPELRSKATQAYSFMLRSVRAKLNGMISDALSDILNNDDESSDAEIDLFLKIAAEFVRLNGMFEFVLPPATLKRTLATLVDHTVNEMCSKVLSWDDISAACANKLASAFNQFSVETSELFKGDSSNPREIEALTSKMVSKWNKFRLLAFVLTASMKEIENKWVGGCGPLAVEFKSEEIRKLIRALFQNTDRRAAFLASIK